MEVNRLVTGLFGTNTYILSVDNKIILIDPACKAEKLYPYLEGKELLAILLTHGHFDHIKACDELYKKYKVPIYLNNKDIYLTKDNTQGQVFGLQSVPTISVPTLDIKEGRMSIGPFNFEIIYTPGHTKGSVCYIFDDCAFTGDTLFKGSAGRTDLDGGDASELKASLRLLKQLNPSLIVYPGHDEISTIENEINFNPFM